MLAKSDLEEAGKFLTTGGAAIREKDEGRFRHKNCD